MKRALTASVVGLLFAAATAVVTGSAASITVSSRTITQFTRPGPSTQPVTIQLTAIADVHWQLSNQGDVRFDDPSALDVNGNSGNNKGRQTFVAFDLAPLAGKSITSATMTLHRASTSDRTYVAQPADTGWTESSGSRPTASGPVATAAATTAAVTWDVRQAVNEFVTGTRANHGWRITDDSSADVTTTFRPRTYATPSERPTLEVTYVP